MARLVSAATVEARLAAEPAVEFDPLLEPASAAAVFSAAALDALKRLYRDEVWLLLTLPIDIVTPIAIARSRAIGRDLRNLRGVVSPCSSQYSGSLSREGAEITTITLGKFPPRAGADRNAFLWFTGLVWVAVLSGFGTDSFNHVRKYGLDYPLIVHFHAVAFVGWLTLSTV